MPLPPRIDAGDAKAEYDIDLVDAPEKAAYDVVLLAVAHDEFREMGEHRKNDKQTCTQSTGVPALVSTWVTYLALSGNLSG